MEAMVCSDNVVRGGLTPKFKDAKTLVDMLPFEYKEREVSPGEVTFEMGNNKVIEYKTGYAEFMVTHVKIGDAGNAVEKMFNSMSIAIVIEGSAKANTELAANDTVETQMEEK